MEWIASPNFTAGRPARPTYIVDHWTVGSAESAVGRFLNADPDQRGGRASAHYIVRRDGSVVQMVREEDTAWHAGRVGVTLWNDRGIGIEHEHRPKGLGFAGQDWPEIQLAASAALHRAIGQRWGILLIHRIGVFGHRETGASTACPGDLDIDRLIGGTVDQETKDYIDQKFAELSRALADKVDSGFNTTLPTLLRRLYWHIDPGMGSAPVRLP